MNRWAFAVGSIAWLLAGDAVSVSASSLLGPGGGTCTTANCSAARFRGVVANEGGFAVPFTIQVQAVAGYCLRFEITEQDTNLEMVVVAPDGTVWRDDNGAGGQRSLIRIRPTPKTGFYTVHVSRFDGAPVNAAFTLLAGMYNATNPNCGTAPSAPLVAGGSSSSSSGGGAGL